MGIEELSELIMRASIALYDTIENDGMTLTAELIDGRTIEINIKEKKVVEDK